MISRKEFMKIKANEILKDFVESRIINLGELIPDVTVTPMEGEPVKIYDLLKDENLILCFIRGVW